MAFVLHSLRKRLSGGVVLAIMLCCSLSYADQTADPAIRNGKRLVGTNKAPGSVNVGLQDKKVRPEGSVIVNKVGAQVSGDIKLVNDKGETVYFGDYFKDGRFGAKNRPSVVVLGYYKCPMLCSLVMNATVESLREIRLESGQDFNLLVSTIDAAEKPELAAKKKRNYLKSLGVKSGEGWHFHTGEQDQIDRLASELGFGYAWDEASQQFAHAAGIFIVSPEGVLTRTLWGLTFDAKDLRLALIESAKGQIGSVVDQVVLSCFRYEPDAQKYGVYIFGVFKLVGIFTIMGLMIWLGLMWLGERKRNKII